MELITDGSHVFTFTVERGQYMKLPQLAPESTSIPGPLPGRLSDGPLVLIIWPSFDNPSFPAPYHGVSGVFVFDLCELMTHPKASRGMTPTGEAEMITLKDYTLVCKNKRVSWQLVVTIRVQADVITEYTRLPIADRPKLVLPKMPAGISKMTAAANVPDPHNCLQRMVDNGCGYKIPFDVWAFHCVEQVPESWSNIALWESWLEQCQHLTWPILEMLKPTSGSAHAAYRLADLITNMPRLSNMYTSDMVALPGRKKKRFKEGDTWTSVHMSDGQLEGDCEDLTCFNMELFETFKRLNHTLCSPDLAKLVKLARGYRSAIALMTTSDACTRHLVCVLLPTHLAKILCHTDPKQAGRDHMQGERPPTNRHPVLVLDATEMTVPNTNTIPTELETFWQENEHFIDSDSGLGLQSSIQIIQTPSSTKSFYGQILQLGFHDEPVSVVLFDENGSGAPGIDQARFMRLTSDSTDMPEVRRTPNDIMTDALVEALRGIYKLTLPLPTLLPATDNSTIRLDPVRPHDILLVIPALAIETKTRNGPQSIDYDKMMKKCVEAVQEQVVFKKSGRRLSEVERCSLCCFSTRHNCRKETTRIVVIRTEI